MPIGISVVLSVVFDNVVIVLVGVVDVVTDVIAVVDVVGEDLQLQTIIITMINSDLETIVVILCIFLPLP
jgi:hypothetical protein